MPATTKNRKPEVSIIGPGRLGTALAIALAGKGYSIRYLVGRRLETARRAAAFLKVASRVLAVKQLGELPTPDLLLITTPDDQIANVGAELRKLEWDIRRKPVALHTSGALSSKALASLGEKGWSIGSIHPLVSVSSPQEGARSLRGGFWCVEGDKRAVHLAKAIVRDLEGKSFSIGSREKPLYHAAAVMASGNVVALFDVALEMLGRCGLTRKQAQRILLPLLASTAHNLEGRDPVRALTGTFSRGDLETVNRHLSALKESRLTEALELYGLLGMRALRLAEKNGLDPHLVRRIKRMLETT